MELPPQTEEKHIIANVDDLPVYILQHGTGWIAVEKPAGMSVHNDRGHDLCSHVADYLHTHRQSFAIGKENESLQIHPVHRIDRHTSGVILLSFKTDIHRILSGQFAEGSVQKEYIAILHGRVNRVTNRKVGGLWGWKLTKQAAGRNNPKGDGPKVACKTSYRILAHSRHYTLVACTLQTGRKHQIRRHAKLAGHPVLGDTRYGSRRSTDYLKKRHNFSRLGLHADRLILTNPENGERLYIPSKGLPKVLHNLFQEDM